MNDQERICINGGLVGDDKYRVDFPTFKKRVKKTMIMFKTDSLLNGKDEVMYKSYITNTLLVLICIRVFTFKIILKLDIT